MPVDVPESFRAMPRWWQDEAGRAWLEELPQRVAERCAAWGLTPDGPARHGSNALVVPVVRDRSPADDSPALRGGSPTMRAVLRLAPPGDDVGAEAAALAHWAGHGVVDLLAADVPGRALLLERLDPGADLGAVEPIAAAGVLGSLARQLAIPAPPTAPSTRAEAAQEARTVRGRWDGLGRPVPEALLEAAVAAARRRADAPGEDVSADGDLHHGQVLRDAAGRWRVVDPVLRRGDPEYDLGRVLWSRLDELPRAADVDAAIAAFVAAAAVPDDRARDWILIRSMSYLLWGLAAGLTEDPPRCVRLLEHVAGR